MHTYPFGQMVRAWPPIRNHGELFVLGDTPSALHVRWTAPDGTGIIALAVDNEPVPFWNGGDQVARVDEWKRATDFEPGWGTIEPAREVNGLWGRWIDENILGPLRSTRDDTWISYCISSFRATNAQTRSIAIRFTPFAERAGISSPNLPSRAGDAALVNEALADHFDRLQTELREAAPTTIVTLGNVALRVMRELVDGADALEPRLYAEPYGRRLLVGFEGRSIAWYPLVHPRSRGSEKHAHTRWKDLRSDAIAVDGRGLCPACGGKGLVQIMYGMPAFDPTDDVRFGRLVVGGCSITGDDPELECIECGASVYADGSFDVAEW